MGRSGAPRGEWVAAGSVYRLFTGVDFPSTPFIAHSFAAGPQVRPRTGRRRVTGLQQVVDIRLLRREEPVEFDSRPVIYDWLGRSRGAARAIGGLLDVSA